MSDESIAIVGASCRFPGASDLEAFWQLLVAGTDAVSEVDERRWSTRFYYHPNQEERGKSYTWSAGLLTDIDLFEPAFFGISPREAAQMDPQQRLLLELVWHALEDAGIPAGKIAGSATGVYIGGSSTDYRDLRLGDPATGDSYFMTGGTLSILANRISYVFDLRGPSFTIDTACSSSLVALNAACEALREGRVDSAIVGGINLLLTPYPFLGFSRAAMLSRRGRCFAFDERADGYVRGEGGGAVVLKALSQALRDGDPIRAVIRGTGVNSDGRTIGLSMPSEAAQAALIRAVGERAGVAPKELAFFEMHGTGTPAGDPVEAVAVGEALGQRRRDPLPIGSVKTNIGHLEPASGMAGLIKTTLALERGMLPPSLHCESPNPRIPFDRLNLRIARAPETIAPGECAGINSFGFGGTNAHAVLAPPPQTSANGAAMATEGFPPLIVSARTEASLRELARGWQQTLAASSAECVPAFLRAAARRRDHHSHRVVVIGGNAADTAEKLGEFIAGDERGVVLGSALRDGKLAFVFSGNGAQWPAMAQSAYRASAAFRHAIGEADAALRPGLGWSVAELIESGVAAERLVRADVAQPLLFAIQIGIVSVSRDLGIEAAGHVGHSVGEIAAGWAAGALSLADASRVVVARSRNQERTRGQGRMAALALGCDAARPLLNEIGSPLEVGAINATHAVTVSGPAEAIDKLGAEARRRGVAFRALDLDFAFHSAAMDSIRDDLIVDLDGLASAAPQTTLLSTVTGEPVRSGQLDAEYWWRNIRSPVRFTEAMAALVADGARIFVEIGPNPVLQAYLHDALRAAETEGRVLATLSRKQGEDDPFPAIAAQCHVAGHDMTGAARFDGASDPRGLPLYPWQRERCWFEHTVEDIGVTNPAFAHPLLGFRQAGPGPFWVNHLDPQVLPWLADHAIEGVPVLPAAAVLEMALAAARDQRPAARVLDVADLEVRRPLPFDTGHPRELRASLGSDDGDWELRSRPRLSSEPATLHAVARLVSSGDGTVETVARDGASPRRVIEAGELYETASRLGLDYGPRFRTVTRVEVLGADEAVAYLDAAVIGAPSDGYLIHPALLDGALQAFLALLSERGAGLRDVSFLPWRFGRVRAAAPFGRSLRCARLRVTRMGTRSASADMTLLDEAGALIAELSDCWFRRVELNRSSAPDDRALRVDLIPAPLAEMAAPGVLDRIGEILTRLADAASGAGAATAEHALLLDAMIGSIAYRAVAAVDPSGTAFTIDQLVDAGAVVRDTVPLLDSLLRLLERFGAAHRTADGWALVDDNDLPDVAEVWRLLLAEAPELVAELALVAGMPEELPRLLRDGMRPAASPPVPMAEHLRHASPASAAGIATVCAALAEIAAGWPRNQPFRILEIGADASVTPRLLDSLARTDAVFLYHATHADPKQADRLSVAVRPRPGASASHWSPNGRDDDLRDGYFDVILSLQALSRLPVDADALSRLRGKLAPGGLLVAIEPEPNPLWDLIFGCYEGWWRADGPDGGASPLRSGDEWRRELAFAGFAGTANAAIAPGPWPSTIVWGRAPADEERAIVPPKPPFSLSLITANPDQHRKLAARLAEDGRRVTELDLAGFAVAADKAEEEGQPEVALLLVGEKCDPVLQSTNLLPAVVRIATAAAERAVPLWIVTRGAQQGAAGTDVGLVGAALWGLGRVLVNEIPRLALRLVDLPTTIDDPELAERLLSELAAESLETEIVWTPAGRHVLRLRRGLPPRWADAADRLGLTSERPGGLDALNWKSATPREPGPGEIAIEVRAAGLNFRDIMWAMGLLPEEALIDGFAGPTFGLECAGIVRAVGPGVDDVAVGDRVAGLAPASLGSHAVTAAHAVMRIPPEMSFAAAATVPVAFVTAIYALGSLAKLEAGEHVLIHAAAGGVGLAAIQYAKHRGATVIATAGSEIKREFLRLAGADHALDSRDLGFADAVRTITGGQGVDVVLNSLSGEAMEQSLGVLKPFGRFLELGKRDFYLNSRIHLRPFRQNISYFGIDVDQLPVQRPDVARELLRDVSAALSSGAIRPLAHRVFPFAAVEDAFRLMQASGHIGKIVLTPAGNAGVRLPPPSELKLREDGTYLVTGGISGFGFAAARWFAEHGAGVIALLGRRGAETPGAADRVAELRALGADVTVHAGDVADPVSLSAVLDDIRKGPRPLRGVVHAAAVVADALANELNEADAAAVLRPKLGGAVALDRLTRDDRIELFLLFSSATTLLGAPGQGAYVAANLGLEALARRRRAEGKPALAVAWGPIDDAGYLGERGEARDALARRLGAKPIRAAQALSGLPALAESGLPVAGFAETNWSEARRFLPILAAPLFSDMQSDAASTAADDSLIERLLTLDAEERLELLKTVVAEEAAGILRLPAAGLDAQRPLSEIGMDSLMAVELRLALENRLRIDLPLMSLAEGTSVASIAKRLAGALSARPQARELLRLAERYEAADEQGLAPVAKAATLPEGSEMNSAAAE